MDAAAKTFDASALRQSHVVGKIAVHLAMLAQVFRHCFALYVVYLLSLKLLQLDGKRGRLQRPLASWRRATARACVARCRLLTLALIASLRRSQPSVSNLPARGV